MKSTDLLVQEHKIILRALDVLNHMAARIDNEQPVEAQDVETLLRFLRAFADDHHQAKEESALFPELMRTSAASQPGLRQMIFEHDQERSLVEALENSLRTKQGKDFVHFANRLIGLIRTHIHKEDNILFDIVDHALSPQQDEQIAAELQKFPLDSALMTDLRRLEWTYLRRAAGIDKLSGSGRYDTLISVNSPEHAGKSKD
jgi:hemerythrin-like domain-containing protein